MDSNSKKQYDNFPFLKLGRYFLWANIAEDSDFKIISHLSATKTGHKVSKDKKNKIKKKSYSKMKN